MERKSLLERIADQEKKIHALEEAAERAGGERKELQYQLDSANTEKAQLKSQVQVGLKDICRTFVHITQQYCKLIEHKNMYLIHFLRSIYW